VVVLPVCVSDNKLYHRGDSVTQITDVVTNLHRLKAECIRQGVKDSNLLRKPPDPEERGVEATMR
jgi:hypothetical protein